MEENLLNFRISSGLKNIIGRELITDDYVAVFELVKNSFDAHATNVTITFKPDKIVIFDNGKGMDIEDINKKWLFVAYSAKKQGIEDLDINDQKMDNYRNKIQTKKYFAGAKGIGRFSCDRLGSKLLLTTKKASNNSNIEQIEVNWKDFDLDPINKFMDIKVIHRTLETANNKFKKIPHGTMIEISDLNSSWTRKKKQELKHSLEKLINPFDNTGLDEFSLKIIDESEVEADKDEKNNRYKVNGVVKNFIFETLGLKTTQIVTEIDEKGDYITITLWDRGVLIYKIRKTNDTVPKLGNIKYFLFFLNRAAKINFKKVMGIDNFKFGSVFIYKNGFRIAPYGDEATDLLGLDVRKAQKHFERIGSRDLIGRIEIIGDNVFFNETSSRDGGLVKNEYYKTLINCFISNCLRKLENYLLNVSWKIKSDKDQEDLSALENINSKSALLNLISKEIDDNDVVLLDANRNNINLSNDELLNKATEKDIDTLKGIAAKLGDELFFKDIIKLENSHKEIIKLKKTLELEEEKRKKIEEEKLKLEQELILEKEKNTYLRTSSRSLSEDAKGLIHNIKITSGIIKSKTETLINVVRNERINPEVVLKMLEVIKFNSEKALKISTLITRANFKAQQNEQISDLVQYINQYITIYSQIYDKEQLDFEIISNNSSFIKKLNLLDLSLVIDDLISNSHKAQAKNILVEMNNSDLKSLSIIFSDDGTGVQKKFLNNIENIFELGITTTEGSGIGLHSVKRVLKTMNGTISFIGNNVKLKGASFEIIIK